MSYLSEKGNIRHTFITGSANFKAFVTVTCIGKSLKSVMHYVWPIIAGKILESWFPLRKTYTYTKTTTISATKHRQTHNHNNGMLRLLS